MTGLLMHAGYLGGVWMAVKLGLGAGMASLIVGLQPVLTALWLTAMAGSGAKVRWLQWLGLALGLAGLVLVVWHKLHLGQAAPNNVMLGALALASLMYLVPPCTAVLAWWLFDELLTPLSLLGLACTAAGVALVVREPPRNPV